MYKSLKLYQLSIIKKIKKDYKKTLAKDIEVFQKKKKKKNDKVVLNVTKIFEKVKNKNFLSVEKNIKKSEKCLIIKSNDLKMSFEVTNLLQKAYLNKKIESIYKNR